MPFQPLSDELRDSLTNTDMNLSNDQGLPFPAPLFYVVNGQVAFKASEAKALYYGGWATDAQTLDNHVQTEGNGYPSDKLVGAEVESRTGKPLQIYTIRALTVAPVVVRSAWITKDNRRSPEYIEGARQHMQALVILGVRGEDKSMYPWGPAVLSAKGFQAKNLKAAFGDWEKHTATIRAAEAPGIPAWLFYMAIGTFGDKREQIMVGNDQAKSPITPITVYKPTMDLSVLESLYGGETLASLIVDLNKQARSWVDSWSTVQALRGGATGDTLGRNSRPGRGQAPLNPDDIPF